MRSAQERAGGTSKRKAADDRLARLATEIRSVE